MFHLFRQRQGVILVLEQHERFPHALAGDLPMRRGTNSRRQRRVARVGMLEQAHLKFDPQNSRYRVVDPGLRDFSLCHQLLEVFDELDIVVRACQARRGIMVMSRPALIALGTASL